MTNKTLVVASGNFHKVVEISRIMQPLGFEIKSLKDFPTAPDVIESGATFEENALLKANSLAKHLSLPVVADDSGIEIDALNSMPGVLSARWAGSKKDDLANLNLVLEQLADVGANRRTARFICVAAWSDGLGNEITARGVWPGTVAFASAGTNGFGYDPIFVAGSHQGERTSTILRVDTKRDLVLLLDNGDTLPLKTQNPKSTHAHFSFLTH